MASMAGYTVGITADRRADEQAELFLRKGARVLRGPTMRTNGIEPDASFAATTEALVDDPPDVTILSTSVGVRAWIDAAEAIGLGDALVNALSQSVVWAGGAKARGAAAAVGLPVHWHAPSGTSAEVVDALRARPGRGRVAIQLDGAADPPVVAAIAALGFDVAAVRVYRWRTPSDLRPAQRLARAICDRRVDAVTFTARPQVENLFGVAEAEGRASDLRAALTDGVQPVCIGPVCAEAMVAAGVVDPLVPGRARLGTMVLAVEETLAARSRTVDVHGVQLRLQGCAVEGRGAAIELSRRERTVLDIVLERPGAVVSPARLLARVWRPAGEDGAREHAVVVTVARLRRRLMTTGVTVENVPRRGYRVALIPDADP